MVGALAAQAAEPRAGQLATGGTAEALAGPRLAAPSTSDPPGHPRHRILEVLGAQPGLSITELALATQMGHTTACHHLAVLHRKGLIVRERWGGAVRLFPATLMPLQRSLAALTRCGTTAQVLRELARDPRGTPATLSATLGLHRQAIQWHLARLEQAGLLHVDRDHRPYRLQMVVRPEAVLRVLPS